MRPDSGKAYFTAYEKRYRCVYSQGITYWSNFPNEVADAKQQIDNFLSLIQPRKGARLIEFGCGEGFVAQYLVEKGLVYTGVDIAESAIKKAKIRCAHLSNYASFHVCDVTNFPLNVGTGFDIGLDISCLHMFVLDTDRQKYFHNISQLLVDRGSILFCRELYRRKAIADKIGSYEEWLHRSSQNVDTFETRQAVESGKVINISIPRMAARARSVGQYRHELERSNIRYIKTLSRTNDRISFIAKIGVSL